MSSRNRFRNLGVAALGVALLVVACGDDDDSPGENTAGKAGSGTGGKNSAGTSSGGSDDSAGKSAGGKNAGGKNAGGKAGTETGGTDAGGKAGTDAGGKAGSDAGGKGGSAGSSGSSMGGEPMGGEGGMAGGGMAGLGGGGAGGEGGQAGSPGDPYAACRSCGATACVNPNTACNSVDLSVKCNALLDCIYRTGCAKDSLNDGTECYCGAVDKDTCFLATDPAVPQGACKAESNAAAGSDVPSVVGQKFFQLAGAVGAAYQTISCELSDETCGPICGLLTP